jgi:NAD(P)-dependent dehydrogenase (short-subunit alcohol dehydrogenase family)
MGGKLKGRIALVTGGAIGIGFDLQSAWLKRVRDRL